MVTTGDLSGDEIPKRLNVGSKKKPISHLDNDKLTKLALMKFEQEKQEKGYSRYSDVLNRVRQNIK